MSAPSPRLQALLDGPSRWYTVEYHDVVTSTNDVVAEHAAAGRPAGLVVVADHQTAGRGRGGRPWTDVTGGSLLASCLVAVPRFGMSLVPLAVGLSLHHAARKAGVEAELKWPNDLLASRRKCAGVLVEHRPELGGLIIGFGVDVDWRGVVREGESAEWTSLAEDAGADVDQWDVLGDPLGALDSWLLDLERGETAVLLAMYRRHCVTLGQVVRALTPGGVVEGQAVDVDQHGALLVRTAEGERVRVEAGDVEHLRSAAGGPG